MTELAPIPNVLSTESPDRCDPRPARPRSSWRIRQLFTATGWGLIACLPLVVSLMPAPSEGRASMSLSPGEDVSAQDSEAVSATAANFSSNWSYSSGSSGKQRITDAIDTAVADMPLGAGIARRKLGKALNPPASQIMLRVSESSVSLEIGTMKIDDIPLGTWTAWSHDGTDYKVRFTLQGNGDLIQQVKSSKTQIRRRFRVKGDKLTVHFKMSDDRIPADVKFWLNYKS